MLKKKSILSIASAGVVLMAITGAALADTTTTNSTTPSTTTTPASQQAHQWQHKGPFSNQALLSLLNIDANTLQQDLKAGQSLADIAGSNEQAVIDLLVKQSTDRIDQAVTSGKLTQDKADQMKANLADQIKKRVEQKGGFAGKGHGGRQGGAEIKKVASFLGVDQQQLMTQLKSGKSLADIAVAQGKTEDALIQQLETTASQHIDQAVTSGKLTQDKADQMKANLANQIKNRVEHKGGFGGDHKGNRGGQLQQVATFLGVTPQDIMTQLKAGQSIADIAATKNITEQQIIDQLVSAASQRIDQQVTSGKITRDKADQMKAKLPDRIKQMVEQKGFGKRAGGQHQWKQHQDSNTTTTTDTQVNNTNNQ